MTKLNFPSHPLLLGFDRLERLVERTARAGTDGYPPFNIEVTGESSFRITLALAGFRDEDLSITIEKRQLLVRGIQRDSESDARVFLHRGIATRQFQRRFVLSEGMEVTGAHLDNGLLHVELRRIEPEPAVRTVEIQTRQKGREEVTTRQAEEAAETAACGARSRNGGESGKAEG